MPQSLSDDGWLVRETDFSAGKANFYETIFTVGNGYQGTRGSFSEGHKGELSGTYLAGVYDHHDSSVIDQVNVPSWLPVSVSVLGQALNVQNCEVVEHARVLDLQTGLLHRSTTFKDASGRLTRVETTRFCSFADQHVAGIELTVTPINHASEIIIDAGIDGQRYNLDCLPAYKEKPVLHPEIKWEKWAKSRHLEIREKTVSSEAAYLNAVTIDTGISIGMASSLVCDHEQTGIDAWSDYESVSQKLTVHPKQGEAISVQKLVSIFTSRDVAFDQVGPACQRKLAEISSAGFAQCVADSVATWREKWDVCDCVVEGDEDATRAVRFNIYHMLIAANANDPRANIGAKSMSGEGYKGHVFWDTEIFLLPFFILTQPETARALMLYRYNTLQGALENAAESGFKGAQFPWESADTGRETTPKWTHDGLNRIWTGEEEIHITACVAYGAISYVAYTGDWQFMLDYGAELLAQTSRFWVSRLEYNEADDQYELTRVIGPDEFHEHIDNNAFTNRMAQWHLTQSARLLTQIAFKHPDVYAKLAATLDLSEDEIKTWQVVADKVLIPYDSESSLIEQFSGYFDLDDLEITEWDENDMPCYPDGRDHFTLNDTMILKQPDVIMLNYLLPDEFSDAEKQVNFEFYEKRTMHKSSLSPSIHCIMGIETGDYSSALKYFTRSAFVDLVDNQGNTQDGMHIASAGGTWQSLVCGFGGLRIKNGQPTFKPWLPDSWSGVRFKFLWQSDLISVHLVHGEMVFELSDQANGDLEIQVQGAPIVLQPGQSQTVELAAFTS